MGMRRAGGILLVGLAYGCGGGSPDTGFGSGGLTGNLVLLEHSPKESEVQVAQDTSIVLRFDAIVVPDCLRDPGTWLGVGDSTEPIPGTFFQDRGGREVVFTPESPLDPELDYTFHLSALTCDTSGRILEIARSFTFRSLDERSPWVSGSSAPDGGDGVSTTEDLVIQFNEPVLPSSVNAETVNLLDRFGNRYPLDLTVDGDRVIANPLVDLSGTRKYILVARGGSSGVRDRAGNVLADSWSARFTTASDIESPHAVSTWPAAVGTASPLIQPCVGFDESVDPFSIEPGSVRFVDQYSNLVSFQVHASLDQKILRLEPSLPLVPGRSYSLAFLSGFAGLTDMSGNNLSTPAVVSFVIGSDATAPVVVGSFPSAGEGRISPNAEPVIKFSEPLDREWVDTARITLSDREDQVPIALVLQSGDSQIRVQPQALLEAGTRYTLRVRGGHDGLHDPAGNVLAADWTLSFSVSDDPTLPTVIMAPGDGTPNVPFGAHFSAVFDSPLDPETVNDSTVVVTAGGIFVPGEVALSKGDRRITYVPNAGWTPGVWYTATLKGGAAGLRETSGNWLTADATSRFRIDSRLDTTPPLVSVTLNNVVEVRRQGMNVPPIGFTIDVHVFDPMDYSEDMGSVEVLFSGPEPLPEPDQVFASAWVGLQNLTYTATDADQLQVGAYEVRVRASDLSGNTTVSEPLAFRVEAPFPSILPLERTQVVWVRFDLDRDGNGRSDFEDDLLRLGFVAEGAPADITSHMIEVLRDGILAQASQLFGRKDSGSLLDRDSVAIRLTHRQPLGVPHMQMAVGGFDPEGRANRGYGDESSGILGRALYDYRNSQINELNISSKPGLGVFPAEMFLFQANIHEQTYPAFLTSFGRRFINLVPQMGGIPGGSHSADAIVLVPGFDFATGTAVERARYVVVFDAADDWATAVGIILAHEIGHSIGLVASGPNPRGLYGDASLHNELSGANDVMASTLSYTTMVLQPYSFRDLNIAYLRQRLLLR